MGNPIVVYKDRTNVVTVGLGYDASLDTFTSEIRTGESTESTLIATWVVSFLTDGTDGELILTLDDVVTAEIPNTNGFMDIKRMSGGEPYSATPVMPVVFKGTVTE